MFVDRAHILVIAGSGGNGCSAMSKPPFNRYARPSGGDGGNGGDVVLVADPQLTTLLDLQFRHEFKAERGRHGSGNTKTGKRGQDCIIKMPTGTVVYDEKTSELLRDLMTPMERLVVAKGGKGGFGNASATRAAPGGAGEQRKLRLELKLIADVGIVGFPNAGKSSLLSRISTARPKVAPYPFTTRTPVLGVVSTGAKGAFVACDIPGLIEGAHEGRGLGMQFLRHVERTKVLIHLIDMAAVDGQDPVKRFRQLNEELMAYNPELAKRPQIIVANKMDLLPQSEDNLSKFIGHIDSEVLAISCATGSGIPKLIRTVLIMLDEIKSYGDAKQPLERA